MTRVAVAGATGTVGRHVVAALREAGHEPVALTRAAGVDVVRGTGVQAALDGVDAVVDVTSVETMRAGPSVAFFEAATHTLLAAGVRHHVALSIVGIDDVVSGYYAGKRAQEALLAASDRATVLRATQFHEFVPQILHRFRGPVLPAPRMPMRPVAAREVGAALAQLATADPVGRAPDLAGPRDEVFGDLVRRWLRAHSRRRLVVEIPTPGADGRAMAAGALRGAEDVRRGTQDFDAWLAGPDARG